MNTKIPLPPGAPKWFQDWSNEYNRQNNDAVVRSQGKTNPTTNVQTYNVTLDFITNSSGGIPSINILNKLPVKPRTVVIGNILRKDGVEIPGTPQITWTPDGRNIKILTIGGLVADTAYTATFNYSL